MPAKKKQRQIGEFHLNPKISLRGFSEVLKNTGDAKGYGHEKCSRQLAAAVDIHTPYGDLLVSAPLPMADGGTYSWRFCNPFAYVWLLCRINLKFAQLLMNSCDHVGGTVFEGSVALYSDDCSTGNQKRPDAASVLQCLYWSFTCLPEWYRARESGWNYLGFLKVETQHEILGDLSGVLKFCLNYFYSKSGFSFASGVNLPLGNTGEEFCLKAKFKCFVQDEKAHKQTSSVKGASGWSCCINCMNIVKPWDDDVWEDDDFFKHYATAEPKDFVLHTKETFEAMADRLAESRGAMTNGEFAELELKCGLNYNPHGIVADKGLREHYCPPCNTFWDSHHNWAASGGISQYHVNAFCLAIVGHGFSLEHLDDFHMQVQWSDRRLRLGKHFFAKRVVQKATAHIKAFASEVLSAVVVLSAFFVIVLEPRGILVEDGRCMLLLNSIHSILFSSGDAAVKVADELGDLILDHHRLYLRLYGTALATPKFHFVFHTPSQLLLFKVNVNCFHMERMHKLPKALAQHAPGTGFKTEDFVIKRILLDVLRDFLDPSFRLLDEYSLSDPRHAPAELANMLQPLVPELNAAVMFSEEMICSTLGQLVRGTMVLMRGPDGQATLGQTVCFLSCSSFQSLDQTLHFVVYQQLTKAGAKEWVVSLNVSAAPCANVKFKLNYLRGCDRSVIPLLPPSKLWS